MDSNGGPERGIGRLVANVAENFSRLVGQHLALARVELAHDVKAMGVDAAKIAVFAPFVLLGYALLNVALAAFLGRWLGLDGGFAVVGGVNVVGGGLGIFGALSQLKRRKVLDGTTTELEKTAALLRAPAAPGAPALPPRSSTPSLESKHAR